MFSTQCYTRARLAFRTFDTGASSGKDNAFYTTCRMNHNYVRRFESVRETSCCFSYQLETKT